MITLRNVSKSFGAQTLFENVSLQINDGDRYALVGPNGAGKSTLFKLVMALEEPDDGEVSLRGGIRFGYLPQESGGALTGTVIEETLGAEDGDNRREAEGKKILMGLGFKVRDFERKASELSGSTRSPAARRTDQPSGPRVPSVVSESSAKLPRRLVSHLA
jgi:ATP-binding cassette subfamily F protein 3